MSFDRRSLARLGIIAVLGLSPVGLAGCSEDDSAGPDPGVGAEETADDLLRINAGSTVTVSAEVTDVIGPHSFVLAGEDFDGESLLVVGAGKLNVADGDVVKVTGTVQVFDYSEYENDLGVDLNEENLYGDYVDQVALRATEITKNPSHRTDRPPGPPRPR